MNKRLCRRPGDALPDHCRLRPGQRSGRSQGGVRPAAGLGPALGLLVLAQRQHHPRGHHRRPGGHEARRHRRRADHGGRPGRARRAGRLHERRSGASCSSTSSPRPQRLGLEVNMNNDAGWNGSGGPWIKPEQSMQKVVWTETDVEGPKRFEGALPQPRDRRRLLPRHRRAGVSRRPATYRIDEHPGQGGLRASATSAAGRRHGRCRRRWSIAARPDRRPHARRWTRTAAWPGTCPPGKWTVLRFGHTSTGVENAPAPASGRGLECDKLSKEGIEAHFAGMMGKLIADVGPAGGQDAGRHAHRQLGERLAELDAADARGVPAAARLRPAAVPAGDDRARRRQPGDLRAVPVGPAADDLGPGGRELRRAPARAGPPARPAASRSRPTAARATTCPTPAGPTSRWASSGSAAAPWTRCKEMASAAPRLRQADRRRRSVHRRRPASGGCEHPGIDQGPRRPGLLRGHQPLRLPPLRACSRGSTAGPA